MLPFLQAAIIIQLEFLVDDERYHVIPQAFFKEKQPPDSAVAVLKRVDPLEAVMKVQQVVKRLLFDRVILREFRRSLWGGTLNEGLSQEVQLRKEDVDQHTGKFQADKKLGGKLVEAGVTDTLGQT